MLNISPGNTVRDAVHPEELRAFGEVARMRFARQGARWSLVLLLVFIGGLFLPWTQTVPAKGKVTTLYPDQRPQNVPAAIDGRITEWMVREGELVRAGDTLLRIAEIKTDYVDPRLRERTADQIAAKSSAITAYTDKADALARQVNALRQALDLKVIEAENKIRQARFKVLTDSNNLVAALVAEDFARKQYERQQELLDQGIESLISVEQRKQKLQEAEAKRIASENKLLEARAEWINARVSRNNLENEYADKIAKAESDRFTALSNRFDAEAERDKLRILLSNYEQRAGFHTITAPMDCYVTELQTEGLGATVKEGQTLLTIVPADFDLAVAFYVDPVDLPLLELGARVRFLFDGWPAIQVSGWPGVNFGTFEGRVVGIDNVISKNGQYRILAAPAGSGYHGVWPDALRPGSGAQALVMLGNVRLGYEIWRQLNGFPPRFYESVAEPDEDVKTKAPSRRMK